MRQPTSGASAIQLAATVLLPIVTACGDLPTDTTSSRTDIATIDDVMTAFMEKYSVPGLWPNTADDPMFANPTMSIDQLISRTL